MAIKHVYFDLGNVLLHFDHDIALNRIASSCGMTPEIIQKVIFESGLEARYETGLIDDEAFVDQVCEDLEYPFETAELLEICADIFTPNLDILPVLEAVQQTGLPMHILSNTCPGHWRWIETQNYETVADRFAGRILSYEQKSMKPDAKIYQDATRHAGVEPNEILFTDDRLENVEAARVAGWHAIHFESAEQMWEEAQPLLFPAAVL
jgi:putative hydrolase of the HAD superfamily